MPAPSQACWNNPTHLGLTLQKGLLGFWLEQSSYLMWPLTLSLTAMVNADNHSRRVKVNVLTSQEVVQKPSFRNSEDTFLGATQMCHCAALSGPELSPASSGENTQKGQKSMWVLGSGQRPPEYGRLCMEQAPRLGVTMGQASRADGPFCVWVGLQGAALGHAGFHGDICQGDRG